MDFRSGPPTRMRSRSKAISGWRQRYVHNSDGSLSLRSDQAQYEALNSNIGRLPNYFKFNSTWEPTGFTGAGAVIHQLTKDWQLSGVYTYASGAYLHPGL